jgi:hypothetical protein
MDSAGNILTRQLDLRSTIEAKDDGRAILSRHLYHMLEGLGGVIT